MRRSDERMAAKGKRKPYFLWMQVSNDEYELPLYVADTAKELAEFAGVKSPTSIIAAVYHAEQRGGWSKYIKVPIEEIQEEDA